MSSFLVLLPEVPRGTCYMLGRQPSERHGLPEATSFRAMVETRELPDRGYRVQTRALRHGSAGIFLISPVFRKPGLTKEDFDVHWRDDHGPLALAHHVGMSSYAQHTVAERFGDTPDYDGIAVLGFPDMNAFETGLFGDDEGRNIIGRDTARFIDVKRLEVAIMERR